MNKKIDMLSLEEEIAKYETDGFIEETENAKNNYEAINNKITELKISLPFPNVYPSSTASDYNEVLDLQYKKRRNQPIREEIAEIQQYYNDGSLYCGHFRYGGRNIYVMDHSFLQSKFFKLSNGEEIHLVNTNDKNYKHFVNYWRYPAEYELVDLSRNIELKNRNVITVDVVYDTSSSSYSNITDNYLRKALIRNKNNKTSESIIQTIQKKQDYIRSLPAENSFIVQGCAGSGKTMVLLHRLRYLIFNNEINSDDYVLLIPGNSFREFISNISKNFNISKSNICSYQEYFAKLVGKSISPENIANELLCDKHYLKDIYSENFIRNCYSTLFNTITEQGENLISICEEQLILLSNNKLKELKEKLEYLNTTTIQEINLVIEEFGLSSTYKRIKSIDDINNLVRNMSAEYKCLKDRVENFILPELTNDVSENDERILNNELLKNISIQLNKETEAYNKASRFTKRTHLKKLNILQDKYEITKLEIIESIKKESNTEKQITLIKISHNMNKLLFTKFQNAFIKILDIKKFRDENSLEFENKINSFDENFENEYSKQIELLNDFIDLSSSIYDYMSACATDLIPCVNEIYNFIDIGSKLKLNYLNILDEKDVKLFDKTNIFTSKPMKQYYSHVNSVLFRIIKSKIEDNYNIKLCDLYKHYWYLNLYSNYLSNNLNFKQVNYIFLDEAQDLSVSELKLIKKVNSTMTKYKKIIEPTLNLFGDTNQTISLHGITNWKDLDFHFLQYDLDENFRNTNQIIDYCNNILPMKMTKIGVDMDQVSLFDNLDTAIKKSVSLKNEAIFIVKDEYAKEDLNLLLSNYSKIKNYLIYSVKDVKGLEFKEIFVFDRDMNDNEKYISYTRALIKLNIIHDLPKKEIHNSLIVSENSKQYVNEKTNLVASINDNLLLTIEDVGFSINTYNSLYRAKIKNMEDLTNLTTNQLLRLRNFGKTSLREVKDKVHSLGLSFIDE